MNKQQLSSKIWAMANVLRGKVDANDYKDFLLGIIFYKFLSVKEENFMISKGMDSSEFNEYLTDTSESSIIFCQKKFRVLHLIWQFIFDLDKRWQWLYGR